MKKKLFSILALLCMAVTGAWAEDYEVQIGEGTSTTNYHPFYTLYNYSISESLYLASELTAAGVEAGPITSLSWYAANETGYAQQGINIWLANVSDTELTTTSHSATGMTQVYTNGTMTPVIGWNEFQCNGDFSWDGTSNLLILVQRNNGDWNSTVIWQATTDLSFTCMSYRYQDSGAYDVTASNEMYTSTTRPNIIIKGESTISGFELTSVPNEYGTITFTNAAGEEITSAAEGEVVTVTVTPDDEHEAAGVTGEWYAAIAAARVADEGTFVDLLTDIEFTPVEDTDNQWTFTMQRANAEVSASYWDLKDIIEMLREQMLLSKMLFEVYGGPKDNDKMEQMFYTLNSSIILVRNYDKGLEVSLTEAYELYKALKKFNALFEQEIATGIKNVNVNENENQNRYYNLNGRKVMNPTKGIFILNGKKVVIK